VLLPPLLILPTRHVELSQPHQAQLLGSLLQPPLVRLLRQQ
jgi:hypothetical protein